VQSSTSVIAQAATTGFVIEPVRQIVSAAIGVPRALALESQIARCLDVDLAVAGDDSDRTRDVAGVDVTLQHVSHAGQPFRREATSGHNLLLICPCFYPERGHGHV
jgi:hypothetical protein